MRIEPGAYVLWYAPTKDGQSIKRLYGTVDGVEAGTVLASNRNGHRYNVPARDVRIVARTLSELDEKLKSPEHQQSDEEREIRRHWEELIGPRHKVRV